MAETGTAAPPAAAPAAAPPAAPPPAAPPAAAPPPSSSAPPGAENKSWLDEVGHDFDALDKGDGKPPGKPPAVKPPEVKPTDGKPPEGTPPAGEEPGKPIRAAALRDAYETLKKEKAEVLQPKIQQLESRLQELESQGGDTLKPLQEKLTAIEKRNAELESHITFVDYQQSTEFKTKYKEPYAEAWNRASADFSQLTVHEVDPGSPDGTTTRAATDNDLLYLANLPLSQMDEQAEAMFGKSAARVIRHVERVRELAEAQNKAIADAQKRSGDMVKTRQFQMQEHRQTQQKLWTDLNKQIAERFPDMFGPREGDPEGNALLEKGFAEADRIFAPDPKGKPQTPEERLQSHVRARNKIANHDRLVRQYKAVKAELDTALKSLEQYEQSGPSASRSGTPAPPAKGFMAEVAEELEQLEKRGG